MQRSARKGPQKETTHNCRVHLRLSCSVWTISPTPRHKQAAREIAHHKENTEPSRKHSPACRGPADRCDPMPPPLPERHGASPQININRELLKLMRPGRIGGNRRCVEMEQLLDLGDTAVQVAAVSNRRLYIFETNQVQNAQSIFRLGTTLTVYASSVRKPTENH